jgi:hypothetical protein
MIYYVGDTVYEEKMAQLYEIENVKHLVKDKKYFDSAVTRQSTVNKDSMFLLESTTTGGKFIQPYFIVDIHSPCVHSLLNSLNVREKKTTFVNSAFGQSNVLVAMKEVCVCFIIYFWFLFLFFISFCTDAFLACVCMEDCLQQLSL